MTTPDPDTNFGLPVKVLHVIPQDGIGGAEIAARSATIDEAANVHVHAMFNGLYRGEGSLSNARLTGNPTRFAFSPASIRGVLARAREVDPQVMVFSLWRSFGAFVALKLRYPGRKFVTFVHNERTANLVDRVLTWLMRKGSDEIWVDSQATLDARLGEAEKARARIISLKLQRPQAAARSDVAPAFVYWGRLAAQKRPDRSVALLAAIARERPDASFVMAGPDHGERGRLEAQAKALGIADRVTIHGPVDHERIAELAREGRFFLQLSDHEGMAMGVVEALQHGLVPVVTRVGQMAVYCRDGENAVFYDNEADTARRILALLGDEPRYRAMSEAAIATFADEPIYVEDVVAAARELSGRDYTKGDT